jgi:hypothetical protein
VDLTQHELLVDSKLFLIRFAKLGTEARERARAAQEPVAQPRAPARRPAE